MYFHFYSVIQSIKISCHKVNNIQPVDENCIEIFRNEDTSIIDGMLPSLYCIKKNYEKLNIFKRMKAIQFLTQYNEVSGQQKMEQAQEYKKLIEESRELLEKCYAEMSDEI